MASELDPLIQLYGMRIQGACFYLVRRLKLYFHNGAIHPCIRRTMNSNTVLRGRFLDCDHLIPQYTGPMGVRTVGGILVSL